MADNVAITAGSGTNVAADDIGSVFYQRVKVSLGADGSATDALGGAGAVAAGVQRMTLASDDPLVALTTTQNGHLDGIETLLTAIDGRVDTLETLIGTTNTHLTNQAAGEYETVAASQTDQVCGTTGAIGDYLAGLLIIPGTTSPGGVSIEDGATNTVVFTGGATSVSNLVPFFVPLGIKSVSGGWEITTGANVTAIAVGNFT
jgi:hypothetical protein